MRTKGDRNVYWRYLRCQIAYYFLPCVITILFRHNPKSACAIKKKTRTTQRAQTPPGPCRVNVLRFTNSWNSNDSLCPPSDSTRLWRASPQSLSLFGQSLKRSQQIAKCWPFFGVIRPANSQGVLQKSKSPAWLWWLESPPRTTAEKALSLLTCLQRDYALETSFCRQMYANE